MIDATPQMSAPPSTARKGGYRENAGRKSAFPGVQVKFSMALTRNDSLRHLDRIAKRRKLSRNNVLAHLVQHYADDIVGAIGPGPLGEVSVLSIRMPMEIGAKLHAARMRTGLSYSKLGEILIAVFGDSATFPKLARKRKRRQPVTMQ